MIIFSRKTNGCWVPPFMETPILYIHLLVILFAADSFLQLLLSSIMSLGLRNNFILETGVNLRMGSSGGFCIEFHQISKLQNQLLYLLILISTGKRQIRFLHMSKILQNWRKLLFEPTSCGLCIMQVSGKRRWTQHFGWKICISKNLMNFISKFDHQEGNFHI